MFALPFGNRTTVKSLFFFMITLSLSTGGQAQENHDLKKILELPLIDDLTIDTKTIIEHCSKVILIREGYSKEIIGKALLARANAYGKSYNFDDAIKDFSAYFEIQPENAEVLCLRASARGAIHQWDEASKDIEKALRLNPQSPEALLGRAIVLWRRGDEKGGLEAVEKTLLLSPKHGQAYFIRGLIYHDVDPRESLRSMNQFLEKSPNASPREIELAYYYRGLSLSLLNRTAEALPNYLKARKLNPASFNVAVKLATTYADLGKFHLASHYGEICVTLNPKAPAGYLLSSMYYSKLGKVKEALRSADKFFDLYQADPKLYCEIAELYLMLGKYSSSLDYYNKAIDHDPSNFYATVGKASLLATCLDPKIRDGVQAVKLATRAYEDKATRDWQRWAAAAALAEAYAESGDFEQAVRFANKSVELAGPDFGRRTELEEKITSFKNNTPHRVGPASNPQP